jgi:hypothetical protein
MTDRDSRLDEALHRAFPAKAAADWDDVLGRADTAPRLRVRRRPFLVPAAAAAAALALLALVLVSPWESERGNPILEGALAAVGDGPVLHVVIRERVATGMRYDLQNGRPVPVESVHESWVDAERGRFHHIERRDGRVVTDDIGRLGGFGPAQTAATLAADYRRKLEREEWRIVRTGTIAGRAVHWLGSNAPARPGVPSTEAAVDAETYRLVRMQTLGGHFRSTVDFEVLDSVARNEADFEVRFAAPKAPQQQRPEGERVGPSAAAGAVGGAQWTGPRVRGLTLREIRSSPWRATLRPGGDVRGTILTVAYGERLGTILDPATNDPTGVEVVQAADDSPARYFLTATPLRAPPPPSGTFDLSAESSPSGNFFVATLRKPGVWILVRASSRELLFEAVRTLRPIPR